MLEHIKVFKYLILYLVILFKFIIAQETKVENLTMYLHDNHLNIEVQFINLLSDDTKATLASGMSQTLILQLEFWQSGTKLIAKKYENVEMRYDIWEKKYQLATSTSTLQFTDFKDFNSFLSDSLVFEIADTRNLNPNLSYRTILSFSLEAISSSQKKKLDSWLWQNQKSTSIQSEKETDSSFSINLSSLFSLFLSQNKKSNLHFFESLPFHLNSLKSNENPAQ